LVPWVPIHTLIWHMLTYMQTVFVIMHRWR
jgi:hypothetical protein